MEGMRGSALTIVSLVDSFSASGKLYLEILSLMKVRSTQGPCNRPIQFLHCFLPIDLLDGTFADSSTNLDRVGLIGTKR